MYLDYGVLVFDFGIVGLGSGTFSFDFVFFCFRTLCCIIRGGLFVRFRRM